MSLPFDATMKDLVRQFVPDYQERFQLHADGPLTCLNVDLSTLTASADIVLADGDPPRVLYHLEFQADHYPLLSSRTLMHNAVLHHRYQAPVHSLVLLLRRAADGPWVTGGVRCETRAGLGRMDFSYEVVRLWEQPVEAFLAGGVGTLPLAPLCQLPGNLTVDEALAGVIRRVAERIQAEAAPESVGDLLTATFVLTGMRVEPIRAVELFRGVSAMHASSTYQYILDEGRVAEARRILLLIGEVRFGAADEASSAALEAIADLGRLERMSKRLLSVSSWQELLATP